MHLPRSLLDVLRIGVGSAGLVLGAGCYVAGGPAAATLPAPNVTTPRTVVVYTTTTTSPVVVEQPAPRQPCVYVPVQPAVVTPQVQVQPTDPDEVPALTAPVDDPCLGCGMG